MGLRFNDAGIVVTSGRNGRPEYEADEALNQAGLECQRDEYRYVGTVADDMNKGTK